MATSRCSRILLVSLVILYLSVASAVRSKHLVQITEENWRDILSGEWMLKFHAPWCPACKDLIKSWNSFADWSKDLSVNVGEIDVTINPGLSGRFLVTALPTVYHAKDGVFRSYSGPRDKDELISFVEEKKWTIVEPIPSWKHPDSFQMSVVSWFFKLSMSVRDLHNHLVEKQGLPAWGSYVIFGLATLLLGCVLGFIMVCIIDWVFPATPSGSTGATVRKSSGADSKKQKKDKRKSQEGQRMSKQSDKLSDIDSSQASEQESQQSQSEEESKEEAVRQRKGQSKKKDSEPIANGKQTPDSSPKKKK